MDKIAKFLLKLSPKEREKIKSLIIKIVSNDLADQQVKKLTGFNDLYRIHFNKIRLIFKKENSKNILINIDS